MKNILTGKQTDGRNLWSTRVTLGVEPTDRLSINLGLRYELTLPRTERYNRQSWIDPNAVSPLQVPGLPQLKGGLVFASDSQRTPYNLDPMNFGPRIGIAYRAPGNLVIRTGYGIFYEGEYTDDE